MEIMKKNFITQQEYDKIKNDYCQKNSIVLIRVPYYDYKNISLQYLIDNGLPYEQ